MKVSVVLHHYLQVQYLEVASGTFVNEEIIIGQTSGAKARIIKYANAGTTFFYYTNNLVFTDTESVVGQTSNASGTIGTLTTGSDNITDRYFFDNGQRDGFYDFGKITLKPKLATKQFNTHSI